VDAPWNATGRLRVYNLHLINRVGSSVHVPEARWQQAEAVWAHHLAFRRVDPQTPVLWLGDFNTLDHWAQPWRRERLWQELDARMLPALRGFQPTHVLVQQLDGIYADRMQAQRAQVVVLPLSDHFPVVADY
jgi:endonuclease/exonuclease/phosphatase (EEP) superfamily protein YafD